MATVIDISQVKWSPSAHWAYQTCPRMFWLIYLLRAEQEYSEASIRGQALHAGVAAGWQASHLSGGDADAIERAVIAAIVDERAVAWYHWATDDQLDEWVDTAITAITHLGAPDESDRPEGVELDLSDDFQGMPIKARADLVYWRRGLLRVWDWKSSKELPRAADVRRDTQMGVNAWLAARRTGAREVEVAIASIGSAVAIEVDMPRHMAVAAVSRVAATARTARQDAEYLPRRGHACAECTVRQHCPLFAQRTPQPGQ